MRDDSTKVVGFGDGSRPLCGAKTKRTEGTCRKYPVKGGTRCRLHGGLNQTYPQGDRRRGGRPVKHGLYARHIRDDEYREDYEKASVGSLDDEIRIAKSYLANAIRKHQENPKGGVPITVTTTEGKRVVRLKPWEELVDDHIDRVRRLELARRIILDVGEEDDGDALKDFEEWLESVRSDGSSSESS